MRWRKRSVATLRGKEEFDSVPRQRHGELAEKLLYQTVGRESRESSKPSGME